MKIAKDVLPPQPVVPAWGQLRATPHPALQRGWQGVGSAGLHPCPAQCNVASSKAPSHRPGDLPLLAPGMRGIRRQFTKGWCSPWGSGSSLGKKAPQTKDVCLLPWRRRKGKEKPGELAGGRRGLHWLPTATLHVCRR